MSNQNEWDNWSFETKVVHAGQEHTNWSNNEMVPPIVTSATFFKADPTKSGVRIPLANRNEAQICHQ